MELTAAEGRVLGCLIEQAALAPDDYPVTLNDLRLACNQAEARQPIVAYGDRQVEDTLLSLKSKGLARFVPSARHDRAIRYSHRADGRWRMSPAELAVLSVLLLGGPQTLGAVQARVSRLHRFGGAGEVEAVLDSLAARTPSPFAARLAGPVAGPRARWVQALVEEELYDAVAEAEEVAPAGDGVAGDAIVPAPTYAELAARVAELERRLAAASERQAPVDDWARRHPYSRAGQAERTGDRRWDEAFAAEGDRALPAGGAPDDEADPALQDRLADIERRLARIEAELGALR
jgi:uncharacterized protein YceH (UPF0502 family)